MTPGTLARVRQERGTQDAPPPVIGLAEVAAMLGQAKASIMTLRGKAQIARRAGQRGPDLFPEPDWVVSGNPVWKPSTIRRWARLTGRLDEQGQPILGKGGPRPGGR